MILTTRYPHVRELVFHYATKLADLAVLKILDSGVNSPADAEHLSYFIWRMIGAMEQDREDNISILGGTDNSSMATDIAYEMGALMDASGFGAIWKKISEDA